MTVLVLSGMPGTGSAVQLPGVTDLDPAGDIGERDDDQLVARPRVVVQAGVLVGFEDDVQIRCAGEEFVVVGGDQRAGRIKLSVPTYQSVRSSISSQSR